MTTSFHRIISPGPVAGLPPHRRSRRSLLTKLIAVAAVASPGAIRVRAQTATPEGAGAGQLLPRDAILPLGVVQEILPEIAGENATGPNPTVMGSPVANRVVTYSTADDAQHLVLSVDQYRTADEAKRSFDEALEASKNVPGVTTESLSGLGEAALLGVVTQGDETHVGGGALFGNLIVNATLQSYEGTDENKKKVIELIQEQAVHADRMLGATASATPTS